MADEEPLAASHVKTILESGLLLDEDYEVLLNGSSFKLKVPKGRFADGRLILVGCTAAFGGICVSARCRKPVILLLPSLALGAWLLCGKIRTMSRLERRKTVVGDLIKSFVKLRKFHVTIVRYLKMREDKKDDLISSEANVRDFLRFLLGRNANFLNWFLNGKLAFLVDAHPELRQDFRGLEGLELETGDPSNFLDVFTLLTSKYLNYLGVALGGGSEEKFVVALLDRELPALKRRLDEERKSLETEFNNLRHCLMRKREIDGSQTKQPFAKQISGKLQEALTGTVNNLSIVMEKTRRVLEKLESVEENDDGSRLDLRALGDLRDHAQATYESLDVLCRLYGILSQDRTIKDNVRDEWRRDDEKAPAVSIKYDDSSEAQEENYELYIPNVEDQPEIAGPSRETEDQSGMCLSLMLRELRQSLNQHERFIAARHKRGVSEEDIDESSKPVENVPKFDLKATATPCPPSPPPLKKLLPQPLAPLLAPPPPPPPPPPPTFNTNDVDNSSDSKRCLLDNIKTLSSQLKGQEEVFGDDVSSGTDSD